MAALPGLAEIDAAVHHPAEAAAVESDMVLVEL
jgi:hypothetical protein